MFDQTLQDQNRKMTQRSTQWLLTSLLVAASAGLASAGVAAPAATSGTGHINEASGVRSGLIVTVQAERNARGVLTDRSSRREGGPRTERRGDGERRVDRREDRGERRDRRAEPRTERRDRRTERRDRRTERREDRSDRRSDRREDRRDRRGDRRDRRFDRPHFPPSVRPYLGPPLRGRRCVAVARRFYGEGQRIDRIRGVGFGRGACSEALSECRYELRLRQRRGLFPLARCVVKGRY